ncbi:hypothetical protein AB0M46_21770 [Dactylosporangium sp. NPDC051485]|uniref:hypothetical protein n=1 Tax=Dactylosporangium sp. NPDC051485 TaxID=3154846 RepID=UPI003438DEDA
MTARSMTAAVCWAAAGAVAMRGVGGTLAAARTVRWLTRHRPTPDRALGNPAAERPHVLLILPMLREQTTIAQTCTYFARLAAAWGPATVVLATTEREHHDRARARARLPQLAGFLARARQQQQVTSRFAGVLPPDILSRLADLSGRADIDVRTVVEQEFAQTPTTVELAEKIAGDSGGTIRHHHHPDPGSVMVDQIALAVASELGRLTEQGAAADRVWIGIYNADSRPHPDSLTALAPMTATSRVVQQSAVHTLTLRRRGGLAGMVCDGAGLLQSRWSLAREIPRLRAQAGQARRGPARWPRLGHCTGHGLFVRADLWQQLPMPTETMNEDLAYGYLLSAAGVPIDVLPLLEVADSPLHVAGLIRQLRQWFFSYPQYPAAAKLAAEAGLGDPRSRAWLTAQGLSRGCLWLGQSTAVAATLLLPVVARNRPAAATVAAAAIGAYVAGPAAALNRTPAASGTPLRLRPRDVAAMTVAALLSSAGPWWCLADLARAALAGNQLAHGKTER